MSEEPVGGVYRYINRAVPTRPYVCPWFSGTRRTTTQCSRSARSRGAESRQGYEDNEEGTVLSKPLVRLLASLPALAMQGSGTGTNIASSRDGMIMRSCKRVGPHGGVAPRATRRGLQARLELHNLVCVLAGPATD